MNEHVKSILKSNGIVLTLYLVYWIILFIIFKDEIAIFNSILVIQVLCLLLAFTPVAERMLRMMNHAHRLTLKDQEVLQPIFDEVYEVAKEDNPKLSKKVEIYISNDPMPNAFALGSNTITVTKGAMEFFTEEELKGVIAHEFGHLTHWDTRIMLMILASNIFVIGVISIVRVFTLFFRFIGGGMVKDDGRQEIIHIVKIVVVSVFMFLSGAIISLSRRKSETMADSFAYELGYRDGLLSGLYKLGQLEFEQPTSLKERIMQDHPANNRRIRMLESL